MGATVILLTGSISFIGLGIVAAVLPLLFPERGAQMTNIVKATILLVSGVYYPISVLPTWMQPLASVSPATYVLEGMRRALQNNAGPLDLWASYLLPLLGSGLLLVPFGLWIFLRGEEYAKRTGRLKRNG